MSAAVVSTGRAYAASVVAAVDFVDLLQASFFYAEEGGVNV